MGRSWYNDKAINAIDAKLALQSAGAGADAFSKLAKIPLDIDDRKMKQQAVDAASSSANSKLSIAELNAKAKIKAAELGLKGKEVTAFARQYVAKAGRANNINSNNTANAVEQSRSATAKEERKNKLDVQAKKNQGKKKSPTQEEYFYDKDGNKVKKVSRAYVPPVDFSLDALGEVAKKAKRKKKL